MDQRPRIVPGGERLFHRMYTRLGCEGRPPRFVVEFHSYTDLTHTIRLREDTAHVRLSDVLRRAPRNVVEAAAAMLLARLYRRRPPEEMVEAYRLFSYAPATRRRLLHLRQRRARKIDHRPTGVCHDLESLFSELNERYFGSVLVQPGLSWSTRSWRAQLGCFDPALNQIVINRQLDRPAVPAYVVAYVLYHEMLHQKHPVRFVRCRRESHSAQFRAEEKRFADYPRAVKFLKHFPTH
jgi:hypothetical protein